MVCLCPNRTISVCLWASYLVAGQGCWLEHNRILQRVDPYIAVLFCSRGRNCFNQDFFVRLDFSPVKTFVSDRPIV